MAKRWEYVRLVATWSGGTPRINNEIVDIDEVLRQHGDEGWELVAVSELNGPGWVSESFYFKRRME